MCAMGRANIILKIIVHQVLRESGLALLCSLVRGRGGGGWGCQQGARCRRRSAGAQLVSLHGGGHGREAPASQAGLAGAGGRPQITSVSPAPGTRPLEQRKCLGMVYVLNSGGRARTSR